MIWNEMRYYNTTLFDERIFFLSAKNEIKLRGIQKGYPNPFTLTRPH